MIPNIPKMPAVDALGDKVSYSWRYPKDNRTGVTHDQWCYSGLGVGAFECSYISKVKAEDLEITLFENNSGGLSKEVYFEWVKLCKKHKMIVAEAEETYTKKAYLKIPANNYNHHQLYSTLCCYRFFDSWRRIAWDTLEYLKVCPDITVWQILHYTMLKWLGNTNHSFSNVGKSYGGNSVNLFDSVAIKLFFQDIENQNGRSSITCVDGIKAKIVKISGNLALKQEELFDPKWTPLYQCNLDEIDAKLKQLK